ncbi:hypothetical protein DTL42_19075 [Bremerella cremea]|uniref:Uncharacterized protein n=1 Tax=Bremerella cremea TaxID=1031537 RepID=A0A368KME1_9BACT|nr:hypothetical protein [Bremerella cremea]RCS43260.1 hypothetical protein DTL42_19075 [Bremerella cremea]
MDESPHDRTTEQLQQLAKVQALWRRISAVILIGFSLLLVLGGGVLSFFTGRASDFYGMLFYAVFPLITLAYFYFILLNPWRDPLKTEQKCVTVYRKQRRQTWKTAIGNGWIMLLASPALFIVFVGKGLEEGFWQAVLGGLLGLLFAVAGIASIVWGRRSRRTDQARQPE